MPTLLFMMAAASSCICASLLLTWSSSRRETYVLSWGVAFGLAVLTMVLVALRDRTPPFLAVTVADAILLASFGCLWLGYHQFTNFAGRLDRWAAATGMLIWLIMAMTSSLFDDMNARAAVLSALELVYFLFIVVDLVRRYPQEPLPSIALTTVLVGGHAAMQAFWVASAILAPLEPDIVVLPNSLAMGLRFTESSVFVVFLGLLQLVMIGQRSERRYRIAAETDSLTGLVNRGHFFDSVGATLIGSQQGGALILFDIDHFKSINDTHGHPIGDRALVAFAAILASASAGGIAARIGGEEFALFLPGATNKHAVDVADNVRRATAELRVATAAGAVGFTVSCGVAGAGETGDDFQDLHAAADRALYAAKSGGRNQIVLHHASPTHAQLPQSDTGVAAISAR